MASFPHAWTNSDILCKTSNEVGIVLKEKPFFGIFKLKYEILQNFFLCSLIWFSMSTYPCHQPHKNVTGERGNFYGETSRLRVSEPHTRKKVCERSILGNSMVCILIIILVFLLAVEYMTLWTFHSRASLWVRGTKPEKPFAL